MSFYSDNEVRILISNLIYLIFKGFDDELRLPCLSSHDEVVSLSMLISPVITQNFMRVL